MTALAAIVSVTVALCAVLRARYKFQFGVEALRDVPPEQRAEVVTAVGDAWRGWHPVAVPLPRREGERGGAPEEGPRAIPSAS